MILIAQYPAVSFLCRPCRFRPDAGGDGGGPARKSRDRSMTQVVSKARPAYRYLQGRGGQLPAPNNPADAYSPSRIKALCLTRGQRQRVDPLLKGQTNPSPVNICWRIASKNNTS